MVTRHTPGAWVARKDSDGCRDDWAVGTADGKIDGIAVCGERDAALIAAAPELLAACERAALHVRPTCGALYDDLIAVITKARHAPSNNGIKPSA